MDTHFKLLLREFDWQGKRFMIEVCTCVRATVSISMRLAIREPPRFKHCS